MTTHLLQPRTPAIAPRTRCDVLVSWLRAGARIGMESNIGAINCPGCLREMIVELRLALWRLKDNPESRWIAGGDTGGSSIAIWEVMTGHSVEMEVAPHHSVPIDPGDFGRCHRLLERFPAWRARMPKVAATYPAWSALVAEWESLTALYLEELPTGRAPKLAARLKELAR